MANATLSPEVIDVLQRSTVTGNVLVLPPGQLDRKLYEAVNKALTNAGGKWKKGIGHVFPSDPSAKLGLALETGVSVDEKKKFQAFYTPPALAARVVELANVSGCSVLEPSAGEGALVKECLAQGAGRVKSVELNPEAYAALYRLGTDPRAQARQGDFLHLRADDYPELLAERVVMNPPFTKGQDIKHVIHALKFLEPGGRLVAIMSPNAHLKPKLQDALEGCSYMFHDVEAGTFKESGTSIATCILVADKRK